MHKNAKIFIIIFAIILFLFILANQPFSFRLSLKKELNARVIEINGLKTDSFAFKRFYGEELYKKSNLTAVVEVLDANNKPVKNANVIIFGYDGSGKNLTDEKGITFISLQIEPRWSYDTPENYLSMIAFKDGYEPSIVQRAIKIIFE